MIACIYFMREMATYPRLNNLIQNEFQCNLVVYENENTIFIYNVEERTVQHTMFILEIAGVKAGYGMGETKNKALKQAIKYLEKYLLKEGI